MNATLVDWVVAAGMLAIGLPMLWFYQRYGRAHLEHPWRLARLFQRIGLGYDALPAPQRHLATFLCNTCENGRACDSWRASGPHEADHPPFCPNGQLIDDVARMVPRCAGHREPEQHQIPLDAAARHRPF
jgi:hypothetical protein